MDGDGPPVPRARKGGWDPELGDRFLTLLAETGNARASARRLGRPYSFHNRRRRDPVFRAKWDSILAEVDGRLRAARSAFVRAAEERGTVTGNCPRSAGAPPPPSGRSPSPANAGEDLAEELGGMLRPGRKRRQRRPEPVIRRTANGRLQVTFALEGHMTSEIEADFLERLAATGNFRRSALAVGFQPASVSERMRKWPAFHEACRKALDEASAMLDFRLVEHAHALLRSGEEVRAEREAAGEAGTVTSDCPQVPFDPAMAMRILGFIDARRGGRSGFGRRRNAPPQRSFDEAVASVIAKIEAIERHEAMMKARAAGAAAGEQSCGVTPSP